MQCWWVSKQIQIANQGWKNTNIASTRA
jgi:hypothetical protein